SLTPIPCLSLRRPPPRPTLFPTRRSSDLSSPGTPKMRSTPSFSSAATKRSDPLGIASPSVALVVGDVHSERAQEALSAQIGHSRSEEHTSELQSREHLVCRLLLEKKN